MVDCMALLGGQAAMAPFKRRRRRSAGLVAVVAAAAFLSLVPVLHAQDTGTSLATSSSATTTPTASRSPVVDATSTPVTLVESVPVRATLDIGSAAPAQFRLTLPFKEPSSPLYVSASLCSGPAIPAYNTSDSALLKSLGLGAYEASMATLARMYVSTDTGNQVPGPDSKDGSPDEQYLLGGFARNENTDSDPDGAWITIWPPEDTRGVTGSWILSLTASTEGAPATLHGQAGISLADSDSAQALLTSYSYLAGNSPNLTLYVLPTTGANSLPNAEYFNSSTCAIIDAFDSLNATTNADRLRINGSETERGAKLARDSNQRRLQWQVANLDRNANYTAWMVEYGEIGTSLMQNLSIWPAVKFVTKQSTNCRLVYDVDFCPQVAYSIPVSPDVTTERALSIINDTVSPNFANFSTTVDTFPCGSETYGQYSPVQTCDDCKRQYQDWLCAVTMPRCVDSIPRLDNGTTAAVYDPLTLNGIPTEAKPSLLPYVLNRNGNSRQSYIDASNGLDAGRYGELLPCIYTCYFVARSCPAPLVKWSCPLWDITAQSDYGTFADLDLQSAEHVDPQMWGGPTRYVAEDAFGNLYCNSVGVDRLLREINSAPSNPVPLTFLALAVLVTMAWTGML